MCCHGNVTDTNADASVASTGSLGYTHKENHGASVLSSLLLRLKKLWLCHLSSITL